MTPPATSSGCDPPHHDPDRQGSQQTRAGPPPDEADDAAVEIVQALPGFVDLRLKPLVHGVNVVPGCCVPSTKRSFLRSCDLRANRNAFRSETRLPELLPGI